MSKKDKVRDTFLDGLKSIPIVQVVCEKTGVSRNSVYRWKREDKEFEKEMDEALAEGEALVNEMTESQLLTLIKEKNWSAIRFWLNHRHPKFKQKLEVTSKFDDNEELTPSQAEVVRKALELASLLPNNLNKYEKPNHTRRTLEQNDEGQTDTKRDNKK